MLAETFLWATQRSPRLRRALWRGLFEFLAGNYRDVTWWRYMNYGYAALDGGETVPRLRQEDAADRYAINLYHHLAAAVPLAGRDVLEIGCGRGGGSSYIARYLAPRRMVGIDISSRAIAFCRRVHRHPNLEFRHGDAEAVPFPDGSFDAVVNLESSFCYGDFDRFVAEAMRVLRPGGYFLFADIRMDHEVAALDDALARSGLDQISRTDITANVVRALTLDSDRRAASKGSRVARPLRRLFDVFMGVEGTRIPEHLRDRRMIYLSYCLRKPAIAAPQSLPLAAAGG